MILINGVKWDVFKKIIRLCDNDSDMCILSGDDENSKHMYNSECDENNVWAYCCNNGVIEWNLSGEMFLDDIDVDGVEINKNELMVWRELLCDLIENLSMSGDDCDILDDGEFAVLVLIHGLLCNTIDHLHESKKCFTVNTSSFNGEYVCNTSMFLSHDDFTKNDCANCNGTTIIKNQSCKMSPWDIMGECHK